MRARVAAAPESSRDDAAGRARACSRAVLRGGAGARAGRRLEADHVQLGLEPDAGLVRDRDAGPRRPAGARRRRWRRGRPGRSSRASVTRTAPPTRRPLHPATSMSRPAASSGGLRKTDPALAPPGWCSRRQRTISSSRRRAGVGRVRCPSEHGARHDIGRIEVRAVGSRDRAARPAAPPARPGRRRGDRRPTRGRPPRAVEAP